MQKAAAQNDDVLCAGGTLSIPQLSTPARGWRIAEMALLYGAAPFAVDRVVHGDGIPVFIALLPVLAIILMFLVIDRTFSLRRELSRGFSLAPLLAEHVAALAMGAPEPVGRAAAELVDPGRFARRAARRGRS